MEASCLPKENPPLSIPAVQPVGSGDEQPQVPKKLEALYRDVRAARALELRESSIVENEENQKSMTIFFHQNHNNSKFQSIRELWKEGNNDCIQDATATAAISPRVKKNTIKLDAIEAWHDLVLAISEEGVFMDYVHSLEDAFRELCEKPSPPAKEEEDASSTSSLSAWFRHQYHLALLLTNTVRNHHRDESTECRFVTILEVALSYQSVVTSNEGDSKVVYQWKPSEHVQRFWVRLQQPIDPNMSPLGFRRKAYGVLVSLSWVPSSKGLLQACSIPDNRPVQLSSDAPLEARRILGKIPGRPVPRNDSVYQVLDRLKDETNVSVVITASKFNKVSSLGIGKTTVAALVAVHPLILSCFQVLWLNMDYNKQTVPSFLNEGKKSKRNGQGKMNYGMYIKYLDSLCDQLGCAGHSSNLKRPRWPEAHTLKRLEEPAIRHRREENMMRRAQALMANVLEDTGRNILLCLDDATGKDELTWFHFTERQSTLATSPFPIHDVDFSVDLDPWGEDESMELFLLEAGCSNKKQERVLPNTIELKQIIARSYFHPIIVRTAARLFKLKRVTAGVVQALEEADQEFSPAVSCVARTGSLQLAGGNEDTIKPKRQLLTAESIRSIATSDQSTAGRATRSIVPRTLKNMLDTLLSPMLIKTRQPSILFKLCLASFAAVFSEFQPIPLTAVFLLWEQLFTMEPDAIEECGENPTKMEIKKRVWSIAEGLTHMGLLSFTEDSSGEALVSIHHEMYVKYGLDSVVEMGLGERAEDVFVQWHKAFVAAYLTRKFEGDNADSCHKYALSKLSKHMLYCGLQTKVIALLSNGRLYQERISAFGKDRATNLHVEDCILLMQNVRRDPTIPRDQREEITSEHFQKVAQLLVETVDTSRESSALQLSKDLYAIGFGLAENEKYQEALDLYTQAHTLVPKSNSFSAIILYGLGSVSLILNDPGKAIKSFMGSIACMTILGEDGDVAGKAKHTLYQEVSRLQGEASMAQCSYKIALSQFEETLDQMHDDDSFESEIEFGILLNRKGRLLQVMGDLDKAKTEIIKCIHWKESIGERSRDLAAAHSTLADIYIATDKPSDARRHIDTALKTMQEVENQWPKLRYDDEESEIDIDVQLLTAKWKTLRPDIPNDGADFEKIRKKLLADPVMLMDRTGYDLRCMARAFMAADEHDTAVSIIEDTLKLLADRPESLERALCLIDLGISFMDQGEAYENESKAKTMFELALKLFSLALKIQRPKLGDCQQVLETLDAIGNLHVHLQQHETAIAVYSEALALARKLRSEPDKIAGILFFLGECNEALGNLDGAKRRYKECVEGLRLERMPDDLDLARPLQRLGAISLLQSDFRNAKSIYEEILKIRKENYDSREILLAETLDVLGFVEMKNFHYESACMFLHKALEIRMQHNSLRNQGDTLYQIGIAYRMQGDFTTSLSHLEQSLSILEPIVEDDSPLLATVTLAIGDSYFGLGQDEEAAIYCQRAVIIRNNAFGPDHRKTASASRSLGMVNFMLNKNGDAAYLLKEYVRIMDGQVGYERTNEYMAALIMLSDIQVANDRRKLSRKILLTANGVCSTNTRVFEVNEDDNASSLVAYNETTEALQKMINLRLNASPSLVQPGGLSLQQAAGESPSVPHNSEELSIFRSITLRDD